MVVLERTSHTRIRIGIEETIYLQEGSRLNRQKRSALDRHLPESPIYNYDITNTRLGYSTKSIASRSNEHNGGGVIPENKSRHLINHYLLKGSWQFPIIHRYGRLVREQDRFYL